MVKTTPREKLKRIRTAQGWRVAYKAAGLPDVGSDDTKRRRLSRAINKDTSGFKKLTPTQTKRVNRSFGQRKRTIANINAELAIKRINKLREAERRTIERNKTLTAGAKRRRLIDKQELTPTEEQAFRDAAQDPDEWDEFRQEYSSYVGKVEPALLSAKMAKKVGYLQTKLGV